MNNSSRRQSTDMEVHAMNAMVDDIERVLNKIAEQLKQVNKKMSFHINDCVVSF